MNSLLAPDIALYPHGSSIVYKIRWVYASTQLIIQPVQPPMFGPRTGCGKCGRSSRKFPAHAVEIEGHDGAIAKFEDPGSQDVFRFNCVYSL